MSLLIALVACTTIEHTETVSAQNDLPELDGDCTPTFEDVETEDGDRVVSRVGPDGEDCRADVYVRTQLLLWKEVDLEVPSPLGGIRVEWVGADGEFTALEVELASGEAVPADTAVTVAQLLSTASEGQKAFDEDPTILMDGLFPKGLAEYPEHLLGFDSVVRGDERNLLDAIDVIQGTGPEAVVDASYDNDTELYLVTVASVAVPRATLAELGATTIGIRVEETIRFEADMHYKLFGKDR